MRKIKEAKNQFRVSKHRNLINADSFPVLTKRLDEADLENMFMIAISLISRAPAYINAKNGNKKQNPRTKYS